MPGDARRVSSSSARHLAGRADGWYSYLDVATAPSVVPGAMGDGAIRLSRTVALLRTAAPDGMGVIWYSPLASRPFSEPTARFGLQLTAWGCLSLVHALQETETRVLRTRLVYPALVLALPRGRGRGRGRGGSGGGGGGGGGGTFVSESIFIDRTSPEDTAA
jgi:hypothetical protein